MYNRYIPQPDGTYRRNRMQEIPKPPVPPVPAPPPPVQSITPDAPPCSSCIRNPVPRRPVVNREPNRRDQTSLSGFFRHLLPKNFDAEDLMVVLLLLLMAGDQQENQNTALLTLVLYLFL